MVRFLIDVNLPYRLALWTEHDCIQVRDLGERWSDSEIWRYARDHDLVIVSKDTDFSDRVLVSAPPPRVIHIRYGNLRMRDFHALIRRQWPHILVLCASSRLIRVYEERLEAIE